jgi:hypothetical protein
VPIPSPNTPDLKGAPVVRRRRVIVLAVCSLSATVVLQTALPVWGAGRSPQPPRRPASTQRVVGDRAERPSADALARALAAGRIDRATYALERARALFQLRTLRATYGDVARPGPRDATSVLRDLVLAYERLSPAQRRVADGILARPTDGAADRFGDGYTVAEATPYCTANACFHWVATTEDAPPSTDADVDGVPDWVETTAIEFATVWTTEITTLGFRAPKSDATSTNAGPSGGLDVYLAQTGDAGYYGYCTTDDPNAEPGSGYQYWDMSAYCVVDNDFAEFGGLPALRVTLAHEFFHAVQFAYDITEDRWFMESTATWIEDEVFDDVDDNVQYLGASPIARPRVPLDSNNTVFGIYGDWIFFRFISEVFASRGEHDTTVVRRAWKLADGAPGGRDLYSLKAVAQASKAAGTAFRPLFGAFGMVNDVAPAWYEEGTANDYPVPPLADRTKITKRSRTDVGSRRMRHLTNAYLGYVPGRGVSSGAKLAFVLDLPAAKTGPAASVVVISTKGDVRFFTFALDRAGDGRLKVPFGRGAVARVDLVLTNASTRTRCWVDPNRRYSCSGDPRDDGVPFRHAAKLIQ